MSNKTHTVLKNNTACNSLQATQNCIAAATAEIGASKNGDLSTYQYGLARSKEAKGAFWFLRSAVDSVEKEQHKLWNTQWDVAISAVGGRKTEAGQRLYSRRTVGYGRARAHAAGAVLTSKNSMSNAQTREAKALVTSYQDTKTKSNAKPWADQMLEMAKRLYRSLYTNASGQQIYNNDLADITHILTRHKVNVLDLQRDNTEKKKAKSPVLKKAKRH